MRYTMGEFLRFKARKRLRPWSDPRRSLKWTWLFGVRADQCEGRTVILDKPRGFKIPLWLDVHSIIFESLFFGKMFEEEHLLLTQQLLQPDSLVLDIGANVGYTGLWYAQCAREGTVISWEPCPETFAILKRNCEMSRLRNWTVRQLAAASQDGTLKIKTFSDPAFNEVIPGNAAGVDAVSVPAMALDSFWEKEGDKRMDLLKIDVEGYEPFVLDGAAKTFESKPPCYLVLEFYEPHLQKWAGRSVVAELSRLQRWGYEAWQIIGGRLRKLNRLEDYRNSFEYFFAHHDVSNRAGEVAACLNRRGKSETSRQVESFSGET